MKRGFIFGLTALLALLLTVGCVSFLSATSVCDRVPEGTRSVVCEVAAELRTTPEQVSTVLKLANLAGLSSNAYTASHAAAFVDELTGLVEFLRDSGSITYRQIVSAVLERYYTLPPEVQALFVVADDVVHIESQVVNGLLLSDFDFGLLLSHLAQQRAILAPFMEQK